MKNHKSKIINLKSSIVLLVALCATGCQFRKDEWVDFTDIEAAKGLKFQVISQSETDLSAGLPYNCYLPDGTRVADYRDDVPTDNAQGPDGRIVHRTSSVTGTGILQEILKY